MAEGEWRTSELTFGGRVRRLELCAPVIIIEQPLEQLVLARSSSDTSGGGSGHQTAGPESIHVCACYLQFKGWLMHLDTLRGAVQRLNVTFGGYAGQPPVISVLPEYGLALEAQPRAADDRQRMLQLLKARIM